MDLTSHLYRQRAFSRAAFGPGANTVRVCNHIRKELQEVEAAARNLVAASLPGESYRAQEQLLEEWVDVIILAFDAATRLANPEQVVHAIQLKQEKNEKRSWPDWRTVAADQPIEHIIAAE